MVREEFADGDDITPSTGMFRMSASTWKARSWLLFFFVPISVVPAPSKGPFLRGGLTMVDYTWVKWFKELAARIAENGEHDLAERARRVDWNNDNAPLLRYGDQNIDPMSFLYFLAQKNTVNQFGIVFPSVHDVFGIASPCPEIWPFIPTPTPNTTTLYHNAQLFNPELLWCLFRQAVPIEGEPEIQPEDFNAVLALPNVGVSKLTQTLFIANPSHFLPADRIILTALPQSELHGNVKDHEGYVTLMNVIKRRFPGCSPYEINTLLETQKTNPLITEETKFFQISTNVYNDGTDYWEQIDGIVEGLSFRENNYVYTGVPGTNAGAYPLTQPERGDIILVRFGLWQGHAIGVVEENGYADDGWSEEEVISVYWINKTTAPTGGQLPQIGFSYAREPTRLAFSNTDAYTASFDLIDRWIGGDGDGGESQPDPTPDPPAEELDTSISLNTILFGPPGTGKTWEAVSYAVAILDGEDPADLAQAEDRVDVKARFDELRKDGRIEFVTFHQSYTYEDFVEGIVPILKTDDLRYELRDGVFKRIASRAGDPSNQRYVLIIDEINRGNIAKIFGELITLIEPSKRSGGDDAAVVTLPYSQKPFAVPGNLYLVGTMNTADRGIALLDTALRRRFDFIEKMPDLRHVEEDIEGVNGREMLRAMNERITVYLDREHQIGHTYLIGVTTIDRLAEVFQRRILPLLQEYFYDDWAKIRNVLNENPFIRERETGAWIQDEPERPVFELLPQDDDQWKNAGSYRKIYAGGQAEDPD